MYSEINFRPNKGSFIAHLSPHGYEKSPTHEVYSSKFLNIVRVREVPSSNLGTPTRVLNVLVDGKSCHARGFFY